MRPLTVASLIKLLSREDPRRIVILAKDPDTNDDCSVVGEVGTCATRIRRGGAAEIGFEEIDKEAMALGLNETDLIPDGKPALVLRPLS